MAALVERDNIGIFGRMNAGKSSVMNLITQQATSIVDPAPGTTADTKISLYELHGLGPVRLFDTAGIDETGGLGEKKRGRVLADLKECDLALIVVDPSRDDFRHEGALLREARGLDKQILVIYNLFGERDADRIPLIESAIPELRFHRKMTLRAGDDGFRQGLVGFILGNYEPERELPELLPFMKRDEFYILVIPMDSETPPGRYLRPQAMTGEYITRNWGYPVSFRLDLGAARGNNEERDAERRRFASLIEGLGKRPECIITDSQAMDVMNLWAPPETGLTTFSIVMINYMSGGKLGSFVRGLDALSGLKEGGSVLIAEACNHSRIAEDIGTVQIPRLIRERFPEVTIDHAFGREFQETKGLEKYSLVIHCGGCMISRQKLSARIRDLESVGVPYTNYGLFLSAVNGEGALGRVLAPWGL